MAVGLHEGGHTESGKWVENVRHGKREENQVVQMGPDKCVSGAVCCHAGVVVARTYGLHGEVVIATSAKPVSSDSGACVCPLSRRSGWSRLEGLCASHMPSASGVHGALSHLCVEAHVCNIGNCRDWFTGRLCGPRSRLVCATAEETTAPVTRALCIRLC